MTVWIASPTGTATGAGTVVSPRDLASLIGVGSPVLPGDDIWGRGGTHTPLTAGAIPGNPQLNGLNNTPGKGVYTFRISGTAGNLITVRSYPGERMKISGAVHLVNGQAAHVRLQGIEIAAIPTTRVYANTAAIDCPSVFASGAGIQFINCYLHEHPCNYFYPEVVGGVNIVHGCVMGNIGAWVGGQVSGYCMYTQNLGGSDFLIWKNAFFGSVHDYNINPHTTAAKISAYQIDDNLLFGGGIALGSNAAENRDNYLRRNYLYNPDGTPGSSLQPHGFRITSYDNIADPRGEEVDLEYNYFVSGGGTLTREPMTLVARNLRSRYNTFIDRGPSVVTLVQHNPPTGAITELVHDYNTYYTDRNNPFYSNQSGSYVRYTLANWRLLTGYDLNSTIAGVLPTVNITKVTANDYETGRGQIGIFNWEGLATVSVDVSSLNIPDGARCRLNNILNYRVEYTDFTYDADNPTIDISMTGWTQGQPVAYDIPLTWHASPGSAFWMFEVETIDTGTPLTARSRAFTLSVKER